MSIGLIATIVLDWRATL